MEDNEPGRHAPGGPESQESAQGFGDEPFFENVIPDKADPFKVENKNAPDTVRRALALPILWFLLTTYAITIGAFLVAQFLPDNLNRFSSENLTAAIAGISGLQGLAAAVVGFYFGVKQGESK